MARSPFTPSESQAALQRRLALAFHDLGLGDIINAANVKVTAKSFVLGALSDQDTSHLTNMLEACCSCQRCQRGLCEVCSHSDFEDRHLPSVAV